MEKLVLVGRYAHPFEDIDYQWTHCFMDRTAGKAQEEFQELWFDSIAADLPQFIFHGKLILLDQNLAEYTDFQIYYLNEWHDKNCVEE